MELLPEELKSRLPPRHGQEAEDEPWIYACFTLSGTKWKWYVMEGEPEGDDFLFFGFVTDLHDEFGQFRLSDLQALRGPGDEIVQRDPDFTEGKLTDVVPASDL